MKQQPKPAAKTAAKPTTKPAPAAAGKPAPKPATGKPAVGAPKPQAKKAPKFEGFAKDLRVKGTTEKGRAIWPVLPPAKPDTKFSPEGTWRIRVAIPSDEAQPLVDELTALLNSAIDAYVAETGVAHEDAKVCESLPYQQETDKEGNLTGNIVFSFKAKASGVSQRTGESWQRNVPVLDSKRRRMNQKVGGGSIVRVGYDVQPFYTAALGIGLTARLEAVQVLDLQTYSDDAESYFNDEDGYEEASSAEYTAEAVGDDASGDDGADM